MDRGSKRRKSPTRWGKIPFQQQENASLSPTIPRGWGWGLQLTGALDKRNVTRDKPLSTCVHVPGRACFTNSCTHLCPISCRLRRTAFCNSPSSLGSERNNIINGNGLRWRASRHIVIIFNLNSTSSRLCCYSLQSINSLLDDHRGPAPTVRLREVSAL